MSTGSSTQYDASNDTTTKLFVVGALGIGVVLLLFRLPFWVSYIGSDRAWSGLRLAGHSDPRRKFESDYATKPPPIRHVSPLIAHLRTLYNSYLLPSVVLGLTIGQCLLMAVWAGLVVAAIILKSDISQNPKRAAHIALAQLPFVVVLSGKHSPVALLGKSYVQANFLHRLAGRTLFVCAAIHALFYILITPFKSAGDSTMRTWAYGAIGCLTVIVVTSIRPMRQYFFQTFASIHVVCIIGFLVCVTMHAPQGKAKVWVYISAGAFVLDVLLRVVHTRVRTTRIMTEAGGFTRIRIEGLEHGWRAGQHVRIRIRKNMLGFESHPITIANAPSTGFMGRPRGLLLHVHVSGDWSKKLRATAYANSGLDSFSILGGAESKPMVIQTTCEGPYGTSHRDLSDSESALIVVGGSGITFGLALLEDVVGRAYQDRCRTENLVFVWAVRSYEMLTTFASELNRITNLCDETPGLSIWYRLHLTGSDAPSKCRDIRGAITSNDRPKLNDIVKLVVEQTLGQRGKRGLCKGGIYVAGCGPRSLMDGLRRACSVVNYNDAVQSGGLIVVTESFSL